VPTWDAWNRIVHIQGGPDNIDIRYEYDGEHFRTRQFVTAGTAPSLDFYNNLDWKIIEERIVDYTPATGGNAPAGDENTPASGNATLPATPPPVTNKVRAQFIYGLRDRNDLIFRDYSPDGLVDDIRHYALSDAMLSTTALTDATGTIIQRFPLLAKRPTLTRFDGERSRNRPSFLPRR